MKTGKFLLILLLTALPLSAGPEDTGRELFNQATKQFYNEEVPLSSINSLVKEARLQFSTISDTCLKNYWFGRCDFLIGFIQMQGGNKKAAEKSFLSSLALAEASMDCDSSGESHRLAADSHAQLIEIKGAFYAIRNGGTILDLAEKAAELDPSNPKARLTLGLSYLNAPRMAGGSIEKALKELRNAEELAVTEEDRFSVYLWMGTALRKAEKFTESRMYLRRAGAIFPGNSLVRQMLREE